MSIEENNQIDGEAQSLATALPVEEVEQGTVPAEVVGSDFLAEPEDETSVPAEVETAEAATRDEDEPAYQIPSYPRNTTQTHPVSRGRISVGENEVYPGILLPSHHIRVVEEVVGNSTNEELSSVQSRRWASAALNGRGLHPRHAGAYVDPETNTKIYPSAYESTVSDPEADWVQIVESPKGPLGAIKPNFQDAGPVMLSGERAINRIRSLIGIGETIKIPLWHSGFWITLKAPTERALVELFRRMDQDKINLGRMTNGAVLSNLNVVLADYLTEFIIKHIESTSYADDKNVISRILAPDLDHLIWGLACTVYVNGFDYTRSVMGKTEAERVVVSEKINVSKIQWINRKRLSQFQINHMASRANGSMSVDAVNRYQAEFTTQMTRSAVVQSTTGVDIRLDLKIPTLLEYIQSGNEWIGSIVSMVDSVLGLESDDKVRNAEIMRQGMATYLRMYSHWVEKIGVGETETTDSEALDGLLGDFGQDNQIREQLVTQIRAFIDDVQVALIALPALTDAEAVTMPAYPHLVPFNVLQTFFILLVQRISYLPMEDIQ